MSVVPVFKALGDAHRFALVDEIIAGGRVRVTDLGLSLPISRQGVRKHVQVLADAGVVTLASQGREVVVSLRPESISGAQRELADLTQRWEDRLARLKAFVESNG